MKLKSLKDKLEVLARKHLGFSSLKKENQTETRTVTVYQIEKVLMAVYLMGERNGYKYGLNDARMTCDCDMDVITEEVKKKILAVW